MFTHDIIQRWWEEYCPYIVATIHAGVSLYFTFFSVFPYPVGFNPAALWSTVVGIEAGTVGILLTIFVFTMSPAAGFVERMARTALFVRFTGYVREGVIVGVIATLATTPLIGFVGDSQQSGLYGGLAVICSAMATCFGVCILRVVRIFFFWASQN